MCAIELNLLGSLYFTRIFFVASEGTLFAILKGIFEKTWYSVGLDVEKCVVNVDRKQPLFGPKKMHTSCQAFLRLPFAFLLRARSLFLGLPERFGLE
jgi:hypothetical protein